MPLLRRAAAAAAALLLLTLASCKPNPSQAGTNGAAAGATGATGAAPGRIFEHAVVFITPAGDSTILVPWLFTARTKPGGVDRTANGWLERGGNWESFYHESWETEPTRVPWRLHPHGPLRLVMDEGEGLQAILFESGPKRLEVDVGATRSQWTGSQGETYLVADGAAVLSERRVPGIVLDLARQRRGDNTPPGDWMFLTSGDSVQVVLSGTGPKGGVGPFEGWGRMKNGSEIPWRDLTVSWVETRAFEPSRREVPVRWSFAAGDGQMAADIEARASHIEAGEGDGPLLPVDALFEVSGTLRIGDSDFPVRGLVRHVQR